MCCFVLHMHAAIRAECFLFYMERAWRSLDPTKWTINLFKNKKIKLIKLYDYLFANGLLKQGQHFIGEFHLPYYCNFSYSSSILAFPSVIIKKEERAYNIGG